MRKRVLLKDIYADVKSFGDKKVTVMGWTRTIRDSKAFGFIEINDGSCFRNVQVVFEREKSIITTKSPGRTSARRSSWTARSF